MFLGKNYIQNEHEFLQNFIEILAYLITLNSTTFTIPTVVMSI